MLPLLQAFSLSAQSTGPATLNAAGGATTIGATALEWSIGEMTMVSTFATSGIVVTQGVLQPADVTLGVPVNKGLPGAIRVFPNPASDLVNIQCSSLSGTSLSWKLLDITGREISSRKMVVTNGQGASTVDLSAVAAALYILEVTIVSEDGTAETIPYKIQKIK